MSLIRNSDIAARDSASIDAFGRWRTAEAVGLFDSQFQYTLNQLLWEQITVTGGSIAHTAASACATFTVNTANAASAAMQTYQYFRYQPGRSQFIAITFEFGAAVANVRRRAGYFDSLNGIFLEQDGTNGLYIVKRNNGSDTRVAQADWDVDSFDGTGPSGETLDISKSQILLIDLQWLGVGRVRVGFDIAGTAYYGHHFEHANEATGVYMTTANLPLRYEMTNTAASAGATMKAICCSVSSEGGFEYQNGRPFTAANGTTLIAANTRRAILSIRPAATINSITNRGTILPESVEITTAGGSVYWELVYNPSYATAAGLTWTGVDTTHSITEYCVHGDAAAGALTAVTTDAVILSGYCVAPATGVGSRAQTAANITSRLPITLNAAGAGPRGLALVATGIGGAVNTYGAINWREIR